MSNKTQPTVDTGHTGLPRCPGGTHRAARAVEVPWWEDTQGCRGALGGHTGLPGLLKCPGGETHRVAEVPWEEGTHRAAKVPWKGFWKRHTVHCSPDKCGGGASSQADQVQPRAMTGHVSDATGRLPSTIKRWHTSVNVSKA